MNRSSHWRRCSAKTDIHKQLLEVFYKKRCSYKFRKIHRKHLCQTKGQALTWNFLKKETLTREFFCKFCEIFENTFFTEHLWMTASRYLSKYLFHHHGSAEYQADCMIKIFKKCQWRSSVLVNLQAFSLQL